MRYRNRGAGISEPPGSKSDGPFADHVGADSTTIWAAATSGTEAIAVHLLACMHAYGLKAKRYLYGQSSPTKRKKGWKKAWKMLPHFTQV